MADLSGPSPEAISGADARGAAITANPVLVGARGSTAAPATVTDGQAVDLWASQEGALNVILRDTAGAAVVEAGTSTNGSGQVTVTDTSGTIIAARTGRQGVLLVNHQTVPVYVDASGGTAATTHFRLDPEAGIWLPVANEVTGITAASYSPSPADAQVHFVEVF